MSATDEAVVRSYLEAINRRDYAAIEAIFAVDADQEWPGSGEVIHGRVAVRMIGAVVVLLLVAGTIEGFVSTGEGELRFRLAISAASTLFLLLYLANGVLWARRQERPRTAA